MDNHKFLDTAPWQKLRDPVQTPTPTVKVAPTVTRDWRAMAAVAFGAVFLLILAIGVWRLADTPVRSVQPAPIVIHPLAVQYVRPDASARGYTLSVIREFDTHPPIRDDAASKRTIVNLETPNLRLPSIAIRREFAVRCAGCHQPYRGR